MLPPVGRQQAALQSGVLFAQFGNVHFVQLLDFRAQIQNRLARFVVIKQARVGGTGSTQKQAERHGAESKKWQGAKNQAIHSRQRKTRGEEAQKYSGQVFCLFSMVGVPDRKRPSTVDLFGQDDPHHGVG